MTQKEKEKAKELKDKFGELSVDVVDEILKTDPNTLSKCIINEDGDGVSSSFTWISKYWQDVKEEINKL